uniref:Uncharacterized protein n=1 Tax=Rhizophora mucronata TaxID=61149 RepID=A0A2P2PL87_RHIMU
MVGLLHSNLEVNIQVIETTIYENKGRLHIFDPSPNSMVRKSRALRRPIIE